MRFKQFIHIKGVFGMLLALFFMFQSPVHAQTDTTASGASETEEMAAETEELSGSEEGVATQGGNSEQASEGSSADKETTSSASSSSQTMEEAGEQAEGIPTQVYINFFYYVLLFVLVCLIVNIIGQIMNIYDLTQGLQRRRIGNNWHAHQGWFFLIGLFVFLYGMYWSYTVHGSMSFREAATIHGAKIDTMFIITTIVTTIVLILTHIALFGFAFQYRGSDKKKAYYYPHNNTLEKIWTIIPAVVLTILVLFGFFTWRGITNIPEDQQKDALQVEVTAEQFAWNVRYGGRDNVVGSHNYKLTTPNNGLGIDFNDKNSLDDIRAGDIVLPVGKPVHFTVRAKDVLHSFYIPEFRVQINAVPGMPTFFHVIPKYTTEEMRTKLNDPTYNYILLCSKICGSGHYNMQKKVIVVTEPEYKEWLSQQTYYFDETMQKEFKELSQSKQANAMMDELDGGNKMVSNN